MKIAAVWVVATSILAKVYHPFRGPYSFRHQADKPTTRASPHILTTYAQSASLGFGPVLGPMSR